MPVLLQICVAANQGSTGRIAESLGRLAMSAGWESHIAYGRYANPSECRLIKIGTDAGIALHGLQTRLFDSHGLGSKRDTLKLLKKIDAIKPDIIHLHNLHGYYINIEILFAYLAALSVPVVWTFHDCWPFTGHCCYFDHIGCEKWKTECGNCPQKKEYPASYWFDRSGKNYSLKKRLFTSLEKLTIVSVSEWLDRMVGNSFLKDIDRKVIYNGVDVNIFTPDGDTARVREKYNLGDKFLILGVASPWSERKRLNDFIALSRMLDDDCVILLVGLNSRQIKELPANVIGLERTDSQTDLKDLYVAADLFMNLSVEETFGLTTAEALACGTPAVVYNVTACPEIVDEHTGFVIEKGDMNGLLHAIEQVKTNGEKFYGNSCRNRILQYFNEDERYLEYLSLYNNLNKQITTRMTNYG